LSVEKKKLKKFVLKKSFNDQNKKRLCIQGKSEKTFPDFTIHSLTTFCQSWKHLSPLFFGNLVKRIFNQNTYVKMVIIAIGRWNRLVLAEAEVATAAATTATITAGRDAADQEQRLEENKMNFYVKKFQLQMSFQR
jgi:hypothetical protein